jgi:hypothetical protein
MTPIESAPPEFYVVMHFAARTAGTRQLQDNVKMFTQA